MFQYVDISESYPHHGRDTPQLVDFIQTNVVRLIAAFHDVGLPVPPLNKVT
jgi:hypothetical protein